MIDKGLRRYVYGAEELYGDEKRTAGGKRKDAGDRVLRRHALNKVMAQHHDRRDGRSVHQRMDVMDQHQHDREYRSEQYIGHGWRRNQQQANRKQAAIDVEMTECVHEILQKERRARHKDE